MPTEYLNLSDIARARGMTRQGISYQLAAGLLPKPDGFLGARRAPIWKRSTLERADALTPRTVSTGKSKKMGDSAGVGIAGQVSVSPQREAS